MRALSTRPDTYYTCHKYYLFFSLYVTCDCQSIYPSVCWENIIFISKTKVQLEIEGIDVIKQ